MPDRSHEWGEGDRLFRLDADFGELYERPVPLSDLDEWERTDPTKIWGPLRREILRLAELAREKDRSKWVNS